MADLKEIADQLKTSVEEQAKTCYLMTEKQRRDWEAGAVPLEYLTRYESEEFRIMASEKAGFGKIAPTVLVALRQLHKAKIPFSVFRNRITLDLSNATIKSLNSVADKEFAATGQKEESFHFLRTIQQAFHVDHANKVSLKNNSAFSIEGRYETIRK